MCHLKVLRTTRIIYISWSKLGSVGYPSDIYLLQKWDVCVIKTFISVKMCRLLFYFYLILQSLTGIYAREENISVVLRFILFVCCLFNDAVSDSPDHTQTNDWVTANHELERTWKKAVVTWLELLPVISWRGWGKLWKTLLRIISILAEILSEKIRNTDQKGRRLPSVIRFWKTNTHCSNS
jgi:hypothetical protein